MRQYAALADRYGVRTLYATLWDEAATKPEWELYRQVHPRLRAWGLQDRIKVVCNVPSATFFREFVDPKTG
ncbi:MAG: hypothetical protein FJ388_18405, partial [Verrucomicrobia bacterium]|nr:hypothetical protein [Verrucomicrobiota bacterium]